MSLHILTVSPKFPVDYGDFATESGDGYLRPVKANRLTEYPDK
jgi:hypothetical protein